MLHGFVPITIARDCIDDYDARASYDNVRYHWYVEYAESNGNFMDYSALIGSNESLVNEASHYKRKLARVMLFRKPFRFGARSLEGLYLPGCVPTTFIVRAAKVYERLYLEQKFVPGGGFLEGLGLAVQRIYPRLDGPDSLPAGVLVMAPLVREEYGWASLNAHLNNLCFQPDGALDLSEEAFDWENLPEVLPPQKDDRP